MAPGAPKPSKLLLQHPVEFPLGVTSLPLSRGRSDCLGRRLRLLRLPRPAAPPLAPNCRREKRVGGAG